MYNRKINFKLYHQKLFLNFPNETSGRKIISVAFIVSSDFNCSHCMSTHKDFIDDSGEIAKQFIHTQSKWAMANGQITSSRCCIGSSSIDVNFGKCSIVDNTSMDPAIVIVFEINRCCCLANGMGKTHERCQFTIAVDTHGNGTILFLRAVII